MTTNTAVVARDDFLNAARSSVVLGVVGAFVAAVALLFLAERNLFADPYRTLYDVAQVVALVGPVLLAPLAYRCIAGDRVSGRVTYVLGLPIDRHEYVAGKYLSRAGVAVAAVLASLVVGFVVALATFENAPDPGTFLYFAAVTALYAVAIVGVFVAISASVRRRSRAMFGVVAVYFVLVPFWIGLTPPLTLETVFATVGSLLGTEISDRTREYVEICSPLMAYGGLTEPVFARGASTYEQFGHFGGDDSLPDRSWFQASVLLVWSAGSVALGYLRFRRSELTA